MEHIIWNGCDSFVRVDDIRDHPDYTLTHNEDNDEYTLWESNRHWKSFTGVEVSPDDIPLDEDGEPDYTNHVVTEYGGKVFKVSWK